MSVEFFPCSNCGETICDAGRYGQCEEKHSLCENCEPPREPENMNEDGQVLISACPCCKSGGTDSEKLSAAMARLGNMRQTIGFFASVIKCGEPWTALCQRELDEAMKP